MVDQNDLSDRLFKFSIAVIKILKNGKPSTEYNIIKYQLIKSATSVGANYEESQASSSKADFLNKIRLSLKEIRESNYWLRIIKELNCIDINLIEPLLKESSELKNILGKISSKVGKELGK